MNSHLVIDEAYVDAHLREATLVFMAIPMHTKPAGVKAQTYGFARELDTAGYDGWGRGATGVASAGNAALLKEIADADRASGCDAGNGKDGGLRVRLPSPSPTQLTRAEYVLTWLSLIPSDRQTIRRIVALRAITKPHTGKHSFSWRKIGEKIGASHVAVQTWHRNGLRMIADALIGEGHEPFAA